MVNFVSLVIGGYVNGYSIISELYDSGVREIWLFDYGSSLSRYSNKIKGFSVIEKKPESLEKALKDLRKKYEYIVCFPTDDLQLALLSNIYNSIKGFCFVPFNVENLDKSQNKFFQYVCCERIGIPCPKTIEITDKNEICKIFNLNFPLIVKPSKREDLTTDVFRNIYLEKRSDFQNIKNKIMEYLESNIEFIFSEFVPGDDTNIYAYTAYRSKSGKILNEWTGKKLNQYPDLFGVFSSASNEAPDIIRVQGRKLLEEMNLYGIIEPEFKLDSRDGKYKLMEINLRSMMWHRVGYLSGVPLHCSQLFDALGKKVSRKSQNKKEIVHFIYFKHEFFNLLTRKGYFKFFMKNIFRSDRSNFAIFDLTDIKPFLYDLMSYPRRFVVLCLKPYLMRFVKRLKESS